MGVGAALLLRKAQLPDGRAVWLAGFLSTPLPTSSSPQKSMSAVIADPGINNVALGNFSTAWDWMARRGGQWHWWDRAYCGQGSLGLYPHHFTHALTALTCSTWQVAKLVLPPGAAIFLHCTSSAKFGLVITWIDPKGKPKVLQEVVVVTQTLALFLLSQCWACAQAWYRGTAWWKALPVRCGT